MRKLLLSSAVAAAAAFVAMAATPASAQSETPRFCYEMPDLFVVACQGKTIVYSTKTGYPAPPAPSRGYSCPPPPCSYGSRGGPAPA